MALMCSTFWLIPLLHMLVLVCASGVRHRGSSHGQGQQQSTSADHRPTFRQTPKNITVGPGDRAVLKCKVENLGTKTVTWKKHDDIHPLTIGMYPFAPDTRISVDYNQRTNEWSLIIQDIRPMDDGIYQCQISTKNDHDTYDIRLNVRNIQVSGDEYIERGGKIQLVCNATGKPDPPHDVEWFKGRERIHSDAENGVIITKKIETKVLVSVLVIRNSKLTDAGNYTCRSSNFDTGTITVYVLNAPSVLEKRGTSFEKSSGAELRARKNGSALSVSKYLMNFLVIQSPLLLVLLAR